jgi:nucleotide-binding universal stress UspA family protein
MTDPRPDVPDDIVVGLDDSPSGKAALRWAADYAKLTGWRLRAIHALSWPFGAGSNSERSLRETDEAYRASITELFSAIDPHLDWQLQLAKGDAGPVLIEQSASARVLVVGTPSHVGLGRLLVGSVGHHCLRHASCPVVFVPPDESVSEQSVQSDQ